MRYSNNTLRRIVLLICVAVTGAAWSQSSRPALVSAVDAVSMTVSDADRAADFYSRVLHFQKISHGFARTKSSMPHPAPNAFLTGTTMPLESAPSTSKIPMGTHWRSCSFHQTKVLQNGTERLRNCSLELITLPLWWTTQKRAL